MKCVCRELIGIIGVEDCWNEINYNEGCIVKGFKNIFGFKFNVVGGGVVVLEWR